MTTQTPDAPDLAAAFVPDFGDEAREGRKLAIICSKGNLDMAYPGLILANAALGEGIETHMFFTFWGFDMINAKTMADLKFTPIGNTATHMPQGIGGLPGVTAMATAKMRRSISDLGVPDVPEMLQQIVDAGGHLWACRMSADMFHLGIDDLFDGVEGVISATDFIELTGGADGQVMKAGPSVGDLYPGTMAALGIVAALLHAKTTGRGQFVDVSMYDALVALCEAAIYRYSYRGIVTKPAGNSHPQLTPFDIYPTADGHCAIAAPTPNHWALLCAFMDRPDLIHDARTESNNDRVANQEFVREVMTNWTRTQTTAELVELLGGKVPAGPVNDAAALFADPHLRAREMLVAVDHPGSARPVVLPNSPIKYSETPSGVYRRAPKLGEHNAEILRELNKEQST